MYIVFLVGFDNRMGKRFDYHEAEAMGRYIQDNLSKGVHARVELFL